MELKERTPFEIGEEISKNFEVRNEEDTTLLYSIIQDAIEFVQKKDEKYHDMAMGFLLNIYKPYLKTAASKIYKQLKNSMEFDDVLQEVYVIFIQLIHNYKKEIAQFSYYIKTILPQRLYVWAKRLNKKNFSTVDAALIESKLPHPYFSSESDVFDFYNSKILEKEYIEFIQKRALKKSRSSTVRVVCYKFFLGDETCSNIALELGISYHAVYEIIWKIKKELSYFLNENAYTSYTITSTGWKL